FWAGLYASVWPGAAGLACAGPDAPLRPRPLEPLPLLGPFPLAGSIRGMALRRTGGCRGAGVLVTGIVTAGEGRGCTRSTAQYGQAVQMVRTWRPQDRQGSRRRARQ